MKLVCCCCLVTYEQSGILGLFKTLKTDLLNPSEMLKISVPAFIYTLQNNLLYFALSELDAATYMVCYQVTTKFKTASYFNSLLLTQIDS